MPRPQRADFRAGLPIGSAEDDDLFVADRIPIGSAATKRFLPATWTVSPPRCATAPITFWPRLERPAEREPPAMAKPCPAGAQHQAIGGTPRDIQYLRWIGFLRYGTTDLGNCTPRENWPTKTWTQLIRGTRVFRCACGTSCTFTPGRLPTCSIGADQLRIAELRGYLPQAGLLPVGTVHARLFSPYRRREPPAARFAAKARSRDRLARLATGYVRATAKRTAFTSGRRATRRHVPRPAEVAG